MTAAEQKAELVRLQPAKDDRLLVGQRIPWTCEGREGAGPDACVQVAVTLGKTTERRTIKLAQWRRVAARSDVVLGEELVPPPPPPPSKPRGREDLGRYRKPVPKPAKKARSA